MTANPSHVIDISPPKEIFRPSAYLFLPAFIGTILVLAVLVSVGYIVPALSPYLVYGVAAAAGLMLFRIASVFIAYLSTRLEVYDTRLIWRTGIMARTVAEVPIENVIDATLSQGVTQRLLSYGDISITTRGSERWRIRNIDDAPKAAALIMRLSQRIAMHSF